MTQRKCVAPSQLPRNCTRRLLVSSFISLLPAFLAARKGRYDFARVPFAVFLTSVNYWRNPAFGLRRKVDMAVVGTGALYQLYRSHESRYQSAYVGGFLGAACCYAAARANDDPQISTLWHVGLHVIANAGNAMLYVGLPTCNSSTI